MGNLPVGLVDSLARRSEGLEGVRRQYVGAELFPISAVLGWFGILLGGRGLRPRVLCGQYHWVLR
jgi:hypothetical protein